MEKTTKHSGSVVEALFSVGAHFGFAKSRRHPSVQPYIFGAKNKVEIFDLEKTEEALNKALEFVKELGKRKATILFVGGKNEAKSAVEHAASSINQPYVSGRWIGGTITNFSEIKKRVNKMEDLLNQKEKGELVKYTKKERLLIDRDIAKMQKMFSGIVSMKGIPQAVFVVDTRHEETAVKEATSLNVPIISLSGSDCNLADSAYPIPANDSAKASIEFIVGKIVEAYKAGLLTADSN